MAVRLSSSGGFVVYTLHRIGPVGHSGSQRASANFNHSNIGLVLIPTIDSKIQSVDPVRVG